MHVSVHYVACKWRYAPFVMLILNKIRNEETEQQRRKSAIDAAAGSR